MNSWRCWGFSVNFSLFLLIEGFQLATALGRSSRIKTGVRDELSSTSSATFKNKDYPNRLRTHGVVEVLLLIFAFFADWRISTCHRSRKEFSDQDGCTGCIVENIKRYVLNQKLSRSDMNSWSCVSFSLHLAFFADFEYFNWPAVQEGVVRDGCTGCIVDHSKRYILNQKSSKSVKNSWSY